MRPDRCPRCQSLRVTYGYRDESKTVFNTTDLPDFVRCVLCGFVWAFRILRVVA
jgi:hypothetical protein